MKIKSNDRMNESVISGFQKWEIFNHPAVSNNYERIKFVSERVDLLWHFIISVEAALFIIIITSGYCTTRDNNNNNFQQYWKNILREYTIILLTQIY